MLRKRVNTVRKKIRITCNLGKLEFKESLILKELQIKFEKLIKNLNLILNKGIGKRKRISHLKIIHKKAEAEAKNKSIKEKVEAEAKVIQINGTIRSLGHKI